MKEPKTTSSEKPTADIAHPNASPMSCAMLAKLYKLTGSANIRRLLLHCPAFGPLANTMHSGE